MSAKPREQQFDGSQRQLVALDAVRVVRVELLVDRGCRRRRSGDGDAVLDGVALVLGQAFAERPTHVLGQCLEPLWHRRVAVDVALAHPHDARLQRDVKAGRTPRPHDELG